MELGELKQYVIEYIGDRAEELHTSNVAVIFDVRNGFLPSGEINELSKIAWLNVSLFVAEGKPRLRVTLVAK